MEDQWRGFVLSCFFQLEALSDISTVITETVPKSQGVHFRNTMNCAGFSLILQLAKPLLRLTEVPARIERSPAGRGMMTCHTCRATESGRGSGCPTDPGCRVAGIQSVPTLCGKKLGGGTSAAVFSLVSVTQPRICWGSVVKASDSEARWPRCRSLLLFRVCGLASLAQVI